MIIKTIFTFILTTILLFSLVGCKILPKRTVNDVSEFFENYESEIQSEIKNNASNDTSKNFTSQSSQDDEVNDNHSNSSNISSATTNNPISENESTNINLKPIVNTVVSDCQGQYFDCVKSLNSNNHFVAVGQAIEDNNIYNLIDVFDGNFNIIKQIRRFGSGFNKIISCEDGYIVCSLENGNITKFDLNFNIIWNKQFVGYEYSTTVFDLDVLTDGKIVVAYSSTIQRSIDVAILDSDGTHIISKPVFPLNAGTCDIVATNDGGFYLFGQSNANPAELKPSIISHSIKAEHGFDAVIAKFSNTGELLTSKAIGTSKDDWCEEAVIGEDGYIYMIIATNGNDGDFASFKSDGRFNRILIKMSQMGNILWQTQISGYAMAVDQSLGIHFYNNNIIVTGVTRYCDELLKDYECENASKDENEGDFVCYTTTLSQDGNIEDILLFKTDINSQPNSSTLINEKIILFGSVIGIDSKNVAIFSWDLKSD